MSLVSLLPLSISGYTSGRIAQKELVSKIEELHLITAHHLAARIEIRLGQLLENIRHAVNSTRFHSLTDEEKLGALRLIYSQFPEINAITLLDRHGEGIVPSVYQEDPSAAKGSLAQHMPMDLKDLQGFSRHIPFSPALSSGLALSKVYYSGKKAVPLMALALRHPQGAYIIATELSLSFIEDIVFDTRIGRSGGALLMSPDGDLISGGGGQTGGTRVIHPLLKGSSAPSPRGVAYFTRRDGTEMVGGWAVGSQGWIAIVEEEKASAFMAVRKMRIQLLFWIVTGAIAAVGLGVIFSRGVSEPVKKCREGAVRIAMGNFDQRIDLTSRDEIGELARAFNHMGGELKRSREQIGKQNEELRQWNADLEKRVEARTRELREAQEQLIHSQKMAAIGELGAGVAHELNNPLVGILGFAQILLKRAEGNPLGKEVLRPLRLIEKEALRCKDIVMSLLRMSQDQPSGFSTTDLNQVIQSSLSLVENQIVSQKIALRKDLSPSLPRVNGDPTQLQKAFLHIVSNARNAMPNGGVLAISTKGDAAGFVMVAVTDTGKGIPKENLPRIFDPFFTTKDDWRGTGLGLTVTHKIISEHKGKIDIHSEVGRGTSVTMIFPAASRPHLV